MTDDRFTATCGVAALLLAVTAATALPLLLADPEPQVHPADTVPLPTVWSGAMLLPPPLTTPVAVTTPALRGPAIQLSEPPPAPTTTTPTGLWGLPFAPTELDGCAELDWYRIQFGLPERFRQIGWRESRCRNEDGVHTSCCWGWYQSWVSLHLRDHRLVGPYHDCGVYSHDDVNSDTPIDKQRQTCIAAALFAVVGYSAWSTS